ncbi:MAG: hydrolase [Melioribacteraceae bacterium]|nr:MAG: hydrolase [Melioribacteraceae bacterium]
MKICVAQTQSAAGNLEFNIRHHLRFVRLAANRGTELIVFPELSLTGYQPKLAGISAITLHDSRLEILQKTAENLNITICVGVPLKFDQGITISSLFFRPKMDFSIYSKNYIHPDEEDYFIPGTVEPIINFKKAKAAFAICFEVAVEDHFQEISRRQNDLYIASVAKSYCGITLAHNRLAYIARTGGFPVLVSNCVGSCEEFEGGGKSAVFDDQGNLVLSLDESGEGIIIFDTNDKNAEGINI